MIKPTLQQKINEAMKARDQVRVLTLKMLSSELHNAEIDNHGDLTEEQEIVVLQKEVKKRRDAVEAYEKVGATDKADREKREMEILSEYLPEQMSDEEINVLIGQIILEMEQDHTSSEGLRGASMGKVIGAVKAKAGPRADGGKIASLVKERLQ